MSPRTTGGTGACHIWILTASALRMLAEAAKDSKGEPRTADELRKLIQQRANSIAMQKKGFIADVDGEAQDAVGMKLLWEFHGSGE